MLSIRFDQYFEKFDQIIGTGIYELFSTILMSEDNSKYLKQTSNHLHFIKLEIDFIGLKIRKLILTAWSEMVQLPSIKDIEK